jgi:tryptophan 2,3-dioxygenase
MSSQTSGAPAASQSASKINLRIRPVADKHEQHFNVESTMTVAELRAAAFKRFHISPSPGQLWVFKRENGTLLENDNQTLQDAGLNHKDLLLFGTNDILG